MTTGFSRFGQLPGVRSVRQAYRILFGKYLLATNVGLSIGLSATGDILQQHYDMMMSRRRSQMMTPWDGLRTRNMAISGAVVGAVCHYWYFWLDKKLPGRALRIILRKVLVDQLCFSPVIISIFFFTMGTLEDASMEKIKDEILEKGSRFYLAEWMVWPPAQMFNFYVLPTQFRVLYDNLISLGFDVYLSYLKNKFELKDKEDREEE